MKLDKQLEEVTEILNKHEVIYWIDSGTLLGIVRDGKLLSGDMDIDISIPYTEKEKVLSLLPEFESIGYFIKESWIYNSTDYILKLKSEGKERVIDFQIYYENKEQNIWYSPQFVNKKSSNILSKVIRKIIHDYIIGRSKKKNTGKYPFAYNHITWVESKVIIGAPKYLENTEIKAPENIIGLLELHFGSSWRIPNRNWNFISDDGAFVRKDPDTFRCNQLK